MMALRPENVRIRTSDPNETLVDILDFGSMTESVRVRINGRETDPVNMNVPRVDITSLLRPGKNTVEVEYSSNLNNLQLARGKVRENILVNRFRGYLTGYESYGLRQAVLIPYTL